MRVIAPNLKENKHGFFGQAGGVSEGVYKGLNVNFLSNEKVEYFDKNLEIISAEFGLKSDALNIMVQGVSSKVIYVDEVSKNIIKADAAVTDKKGIILAVKAADCAPVLLADYTNNIIGAAHAGWEGAINGVIENTVKKMVSIGADIKNITAAIGPCIAQKSYEVDDKIYQRFISEDKNLARFFINGKAIGFYQFDLEAFVNSKLEDMGIKDIFLSKEDTYSLKDKYYSFRRVTHLGLVKEGCGFPNQISCITL